MKAKINLRKTLIETDSISFDPVPIFTINRVIQLDSLWFVNVAPLQYVSTLSYRLHTL